MRRPLALLLAVAAAPLLLVAAAHAGKPEQGTATPLIVGAGPVDDPGDVVSPGIRRVTFSPDGDGSDDVVRIRVRATQGHPLSLRVAPIMRHATEIPAGAARAGVTTLTWNGLEPDGSRYVDGSYSLRVCDEATRSCSSGRVLAHLRVIEISVRRDTAVSSGDSLQVDIATDRRPPYLLDLVSAADPAGRGLGAEEVGHAGLVEFRVPAVPAGGLWLLRVKSGTARNQFPLVVHQPALRLATPPPHTALVVYPYLTWRAYDMDDENRDGIVDSWYSHPRTPVVPLYGPFEPATDDPVFEGREPNPQSQDAFAAWLAEHHLVAEHVTDVELGTLAPDVLARYAAIVFEGHTEYYERSTYAKVLAYRNGGGHLLFLQGNSFYGAARVAPTTVTRLSYRYRTAARSDFAIAGIGFRSCCWPASIRPVYRLGAGVVQALPWLFAGTGLKDGDPFGLALGEVDAVDPKLSPPGTLTIATATVPPFRSSSDKETDGWIGSRPIPYEPSWKHAQQIAIAYARTGKGEVFSWGNTGFMKVVRYGYGVPLAERRQLDRAALNVWQRFVR